MKFIYMMIKAVLKAVQFLKLSDYKYIFFKHEPCTQQQFYDSYVVYSWYISHMLSENKDDFENCCGSLIQMPKMNKHGLVWIADTQ